MAKILSRRKKPKAIRTVPKKEKHEPKAIEAPKGEKAAHAHKEAETRRHGKSDLDQLKDIIVKYFSILPFIRKQELANLIVNPDEAISQEIHATSITRGYKDYVVPAYYLVIPILILYSFILILSSLGTALPIIAIIWIGGIVAVPIAVFLGQFLGTLAIFIFAMLLGGKGSFSKMMGIYGSIAGAITLLNLPLTLLSFIPCIGYLFSFILIIVSIYQLYLIYRLNVHLHGLNKTNSILAILIPYVIISLIILIIVFILLGFFFVGALTMMESILMTLPPN
ncbi:MAG: Yip1 family protein [Candidatus Micrarchaeota archaeon]|nr:Yip1 family protein [Candidatus Micrarchaeota archaeon]